MRFRFPTRWSPRGSERAQHPARRAQRNPQPTLDALEDRVVLSWFGGRGEMGWFGPNLATALISQGVVPGSTSSGTTTTPPSDRDRSTATGPWAQLEKDLQTLRTDVQAVASASTATQTELRTIALDSLMITWVDGATINATALNTATKDLVTAIADGSYASDATKAAALQTEFNNVFSGGTATQTAITQAFNDEVKYIQDSKITTAQLTQIATDQAAVVADYNAFYNTPQGAGSVGDSDNPGSGTTTGTTGTTTGTTSTSAGTDTDTHNGTAGCDNGSTGSTGTTASTGTTGTTGSMGTSSSSGSSSSSNNSVSLITLETPPGTTAAAALKSPVTPAKTVATVVHHHTTTHHKHH